MFLHDALHLKIGRSSLSGLHAKWYAVVSGLGARAGDAGINGDTAGTQPRWSLDFVADTYACGRGIPNANVINRDSREWLTCIDDTWVLGRHVIRELQCMLVSDNRTELTAHTVLPRCQYADVKWHYVTPGKS